VGGKVDKFKNSRYGVYCKQSSFKEMGKPELLEGNFAVFCSPRIIDEYRLVYEKKRNIFLICRATFIIKNKLPESNMGF